MSLAVGAVFAVAAILLAPPIWGHFFGSEPIEPTSPVAYVTYTARWTGHTEAGGVAGADMLVTGLVLNSLALEPRAVIEMRPVLDEPAGMPRFEDYEPTRFWTTDSCNSAAFAVASDKPRVVIMPDVGLPFTTFTEPGDRYFAPPESIFVRFNGGDIVLVSPGKRGDPAEMAFEEEVTAIFETCVGPEVADELTGGDLRLSRMTD